MIWNCQNVSYLLEKDLGIQDGLYHNFLTRKIKLNLDKYRKLESLPKASFCDYFNPLKHTGAINCFFVLVGLAFISLFFLTGSLIEEKNKYDKSQTLIIQQKLFKEEVGVGR